MLDCGVSFKSIKPYLKDIKVIFITHQHSDHMNLSTMLAIHKLRPTIRFSVGFFLKDKLLGAGIKNSKIDVLKQNKTYNYGLFEISPFICLHDVKNFGVKIFDKKTKQKIIYAVDTKSLNHVEAKDYDLYLIEGNYDEEVLEQNIKEDEENGVYCYCKRVKETHLSIQQASDFIMKNIGDKGIYELIHTSERNA